MIKPELFDLLTDALEAGDLFRSRSLWKQVQEGGSGGGELQLAAEVLHELRQPLLGLKAYLQLLNDPSTARLAPMLLSQVGRMESIIDDFTRIAHDKPAPLEPVALAEHVTEAARMFQLNPESASVELVLDLDPQVALEGNARLLEQLTLNLLNNAREAMGGVGKLKAVVRYEQQQPTLLVADWGPGISEQMKGTMFEPYVTSRAKGSGLGLAVCKRIAADHHAHIDLAPPSTLGDDSPPSAVFRVVFKAPSAATASLVSNTLRKVPVSARPKKRVLLVDDEAIIRTVFQQLIGEEFELVQEASGEDGIVRLRQEKFDLIVTDKNLPGVSGMELAAEARRLDPNSKVILITGYPSVLTAAQAVELGVRDYLIKPFDDILAVRQMLRRAVEAKPAVLPVSSARSQRVDLYEDNPADAKQLVEALRLLGLTANPISEAKPDPGAPPAAVILSWEFRPASGEQAIALGQRASRGAPFLIFAEHLTMDCALLSLRGGAAACLPKLLNDPKALSRELDRLIGKR